MPGHEILRAGVSATAAAGAEIVQKMMTAEVAKARHVWRLGAMPDNGGLVKAAGGELEHPGSEA